MKKLVALVMALAMVLSMVSAVAEAPKTLTYATTQVNNGEPIAIDFWIQTELQPIYQKYVDAYTALHPNVTFNVTPAEHTDLFTKLGMALPNGTGPDLFHMHNSFTQDLIKSMKPYDPAVIDPEALANDFVAVEDNKINGESYYISLGMMTSGVYYNKAMWEAAGLTEADEPKTWEELRAIAKKLTQYDENGNITVCGFSYNDQFEYILQALNYQAGNPMFEKDGSNPIFNDTFKEKMQWLLDLYNVDKVGSTEFPMAVLGFVQSTNAMTYAWGWFGQWMQMNAPDMEYGYFKLPTKDGEVPPAYDRVNHELSLGINDDVTDAEYAVCNDFLLYLFASNEFDVDFATALYVTPAKKVCTTDERITNDIVLYTSASVLDRCVYPGDYSSDYATVLHSYLYEGILLNGEDIDSAIQDAYDEIMDKFDGSGFVSLESAYAYADELIWE